MYIFITVLSASIIIFYAYHTIIAATGRLFMNKRYKETVSDKINRFCIIVCARNEELVIGNLINSLNEQNYPKSCFDIHVIADNCTDKTAQIAKVLGATVTERFDIQRIGKGYALNCFFNTVNTSGYDTFCIFDADNIADADFLTHMNSRINNGEKIITGLRKAQNPTESFTSSCYSLYFAFIMQLVMKPRYNMGLSCLVGGTGFAFASELVKNGWNTQTLTEDAEFSIQSLLDGNMVSFCEDAIFYDEQPASFKTSIYQRYRWTAGTVHCIKAYGSKLFKAAKEKNNSKSIKRSASDCLMLLISAAANALPVFILAAAGLIAARSGFNFTAVCGMLITSFASNSLFALATVWLSGASFNEHWRAILFYPVFCTSWSVISVFACLPLKATWKPIAHTGKALPGQRT